MALPSYLHNSEPGPLVDLLDGRVDETDWSLDPEIVLSPASSRILVKTHETIRTLFGAGRLEAFGLDPNLPGTGKLMGHMRRVAILCLAIADTMKEQKQSIPVCFPSVALGGGTHDTGKLKPEIQKLVWSNERIEKTDPRWQQIVEHPKVGHDFVVDNEDVPFSIRSRVSKAILYHHEQMLKEKGYYQADDSLVPIEARIITIADAIDVMIERGKHQDLKSLPNALDVISKCSDQFHPRVAVAAFAALNTDSGMLIYSHEKKHARDEGLKKLSS